MSLTTTFAGVSGAGGGGSSLLTGLLHFYRAEEATGQTRLDSVAASPLNLPSVNGVARGTGKIDFCCVFDSSLEQRLEAAAVASVQPTGSFQLFGWFKTATGGSLRLGRYDQFSGDNRSYLLRADSIPRFFASGDGTNDTMTQAFDIVNGLTAGTWYAIRGWYDDAAQEVGVQIDLNAPVTQPHAFGVFAGTAPFMAGGEVGQSYSDGSLDEFGMASRVWTDAEWAWFVNSGAGRAYPWAGGP